MMRVVFTIFFACLLVHTACGQFKPNRYLYVNDKEQYVLSENTPLNDRINQSFNSLFIWEKDKVVRVIFKYLRNIPKPKAGGGPQLQSFDSFIPPFKKYAVHERNTRVQLVNPWIYKGTVHYLENDEYNPGSYMELLKISINNWNTKHNPFSDKFGEIIIFDGDPEVLVRNEKRKEEYTDNLPLLLNTSYKDSLMLIKPYIIDVYRLEEHPVLVSRSLNYNTYKLYATVSLADDSFADSYTKGNGHWLKRFTMENTLPYLHKVILPADEGMAVKALSAFSLSDRKYYLPEYDNTSDIVVEDAKTVLINPDPKAIAAQKRRDSIQKAKADSVRIAFENDCFGHFQYCPQCYDNNLTREDRIKMHCPIKVSPKALNPDENWSLAFFDKNRAFFKVEAQMYVSIMDDPNTTQVSEGNYPVRWLLMTPGVGFWMTNVAGNSRQYLAPNKSKLKLYLNNKIAFDQSP